MKINIIGDIAGRYDELMLLLQKMPEDDLILSVGDMTDRGPKSRQVIEWFMKQQKLGKAEALYGNHEDLFFAGITRGDLGDWMRNGGTTTALTYIDDCKDCNTVSDLIEVSNKKGYVYVKDIMSDVKVSKEVIDWLQTRPMYFQTEDLFVSHAPITSLKDIPEDPYGRDYFFIWNRFEPLQPQAKFLVNGHNGRLREYKSKDGSVFGMCIDDSHNGVLTGMHWPSKEIFQQDYLDKTS